MLSSVLRKQVQSLFPATLHGLSWRSLSSTAATAPSQPSSSSTSTIPWFVDPSDAEPSTPSSYTRNATQPQPSSRPLAPLPSAIPPDHPITRLHDALKFSSHLEPGTLLVRQPIPTAMGPALPDSIPKGRRKRGRSYLGEGVPQKMSGIWDWLVIAQVKEGTEKRGAIESVIRVVRKALLTSDPPLPLPPNNKRRVNGGWAMIDAGDFAVHIVSNEAREKYFPERREW